MPQSQLFPGNCIRLGAGSFLLSLAVVVTWVQSMPPGPSYTFEGICKPSIPCNSKTSRFTCRSLSPNAWRNCVSGRKKGSPWGDTHILRTAMTSGPDNQHRLQPLLTVSALSPLQRNGGKTTEETRRENCEF